MKVFYTRKRENSEAFCKKILRERYGADPEFLRGENGKPYLANSPLKISISHSGELLAVAVGECEVGLDIELKREIQRFSMLSRMGEREREEDFFRLWTTKESYVKFRGSTLAHMLKSLVYYGGVLYENGAPAPVFLTYFEIENYAFTLCTAQKIQAETEEIL